MTYGSKEINVSIGGTKTSITVPTYYNSIKVNAGDELVLRLQPALELEQPHAKKARGGKTLKS